MKPNKIFDIMDLTLKIRRTGGLYNPLFVSAPGLGKTEITQAYAKARDLQCITLSLSSFDPPDFKGFPITQVVNGRQRLSFATPDFWPDSGEGVIILEELNRSPNSIMQCILSLSDARRGFDGYKLPDGWIVVGCINPENSEYDVNSMDPALKDRFEMFQVAYDRESFVKFMKESDWHKDIINFVDSGLWVYSLPENVNGIPGSKYIAPRTLSKLNVVLKAGFDPADELMLYETTLGSNVAKDFYMFRHEESPVMLKDLNTKLKKSLDKLKKFSDPNNYKNGMISLTVKDIIDNDNKEKDEMISDETLAAVVEVIPMEQGAPLIRELEFKRKDDTILQRLMKLNPKIKTSFKDVMNYGK